MVNGLLEYYRFASSVSHRRREQITRAEGALQRTYTPQLSTRKCKAAPLSAAGVNLFCFPAVVFHSWPEEVENGPGMDHGRGRMDGCWMVVSS